MVSFIRPQPVLRGGTFSIALAWSMFCGSFLQAEDCNHNGVDDAADISSQASKDCNQNDIPDECDLAPSFNLQASGEITAGIKPWGSVAADFNKDLFDDFAVVNNESNNMSVLTNNKNGGFTKRDLATDEFPRDVVAGNVDGDQDIDLVVSNCCSSFDATGQITVFKNNGAGFFINSGNFPTGGQNSMSAVLADLDGDQDLDVATGDRETHTISVLKNNGSGSFAPALTYGTGLWPDSIAAADLDGDGDNDLVTSDEQSNTATVLTNNGSGAFVASLSLAVGTTPYDVKAADVNGDNLPDVLAASNASNELTVYLNKGKDGGGAWLGFEPRKDHFLLQGPTSIIFADVDGDGDLDGAASIFNDNHLQILFNDGAGHFEKSKSYLVGSGPRRVAALKIDADQNVDFITSNLLGGTLTVMKSSPKPYSNDVNSNTIPDECEPDCNSNGLPDSYDISTGAPDCNQNGVPDACDLGLFALAPQIPLEAGGFQNEDVIAGDLDGDQWPDLAGANFGSDTVSVFWNNGDGTFADAQVYISGDGSTQLIAVDIVGAASANPDGLLDLVVAAQLESRVSILRNVGGRSSAFKLYKKINVGNQPVSLFAADLNKDGRLDLITANNVSNDVSVLINQGNGNFTSTLLSGLSGPNHVMAADLDGDKYLDLAVTNFSSSSVTLYYGQGTVAFTRNDVNVGPMPLFMDIADLDGDGKLDLAVANTAFQGGVSGVSVLWNQGGRNNFDRKDLTAGTKPSAVYAADLDGDGKPDLAVSNLESRNVTVFLNQGARTLGKAGNFTVGDGAYNIICADVDKDNRLDVITDNRVSNTVSILFNRSSPKTSEDCNKNKIPDECEAALPPGCLPGGKQIPGDCNQDGEMDLSDAICILGALFLGDPPTFPCGNGQLSDAGNRALLDWQPDGEVDLSDAVSLLQFKFLGGPRHALAVPGQETSACVPMAGCGSTATCP